MIVLPRLDEMQGAGWPTEGAAGGSFLTGAATPQALGSFRLPDAPHLVASAPADDDPVVRADSMRERAGQVLRRQRAIGAFNRDLDALAATIAEGSGWSEGLAKYDHELGNLRQKHLAALRTPEDRAAFEAHADTFAAMQRIGLKRALTERQQADALALLDDQLAYYAGKAAEAPNEVFRQMAIEAGERAIGELRDAGYLFPESADRHKQAFLGRIDGADLESIVRTYPDAAPGLLDNPALFPNVGAAARQKLKQFVNPGQQDLGALSTEKPKEPIEIKWADTQVSAAATPINSITQFDQCVAQNGILGSFSTPQGMVDICSTGPTVSTLGPGDNPTITIEVESGSVLARDAAGDVHSATARPGQTATMTIDTETGEISIFEPGKDI